MAPAAIPYIVAAAAVVGAGASIASAKEAKRQGRAQKEQAEQAQAANTAEAARKRRSDLRRARAQQASIEAAGIQAGTTGSSSILGAQQGAAGQVADNTAKTSGELLNIGNMSAQNQIIAASQNRQQTFAAIGNFARSVGTAAGGFA